MFRFIALAALAAPALAFKGVSPLRARSSALFATEENPLPETTPAAVVPEEVKEVVGEVKEAVEAVAEKVPLPEPEAPKGPRKAQWLPFGLVDAPEMLDGTLAGDVGFDPLGFADSEAQLIWMREAEVKHCRLAMLAAIGWPMAEKVHGGLATTFGLDYLLSDGGKAPSVLNGGLGNLIIAVGLGFAAVLASAIEVNSLSNGTQKRWEEEKADNYNTGELGFDPLGLYTFWGETEGAKFAMRTAELKNGRTAMLGITIFAIQEKLSGVPVVESSAWAFRPFWENVFNTMQTI